MNPNTKRRFAIFGAGLVVGTLMSILLFQYASMVEEPRETKKVEVILTKCDLAPGDRFSEECVERRVVAQHFVPPDVIMSSQSGLWVGEEIQVDLSAGDAVRTVDFELPEAE